MSLDLKQDWVIHSILPRGGLFMMAGPPKVGKSYAVLDMAHSIVNSTEHFWHGFAVEAHGDVLYCQADMPTGSHRRRITKLEESSYNFNRLWHITMDEFPPSFDILREANFNWLKAQIEDLKPKVIIFDVVRRFYKGDENSSDLAGQFIASINDLIQAGDSSGILLHHTNKTSEISKNMGIEKDPISAVRGSSVIAGSVDTICAFNDNGNQMWYQGRDVSLKYGVRRDKNGIHHRWIKANHNQRASAIEHLIARFVVQKPQLGKDDVYSLCLPHVENFEYEEFKTLYSLVLSKVSTYEWN